MSLNGLVQPWPRKCESFSNRLVWAEQLQPQGLGPFIDPRLQCDYGSIAPYTQTDIQRGMQLADLFREAGYFGVTPCSTLSPILYERRRDPNPVKPWGTPKIGWPYNC